MRIGRRSAGFLGALLALALHGVPSEAQTLRGRILDSASGEPVALAYVGLFEEGQELVVASLANELGTFTVTAPEGGDYFVYVARQGYETLMDGVFELGDDGTFDVQIGLKPLPIELDEIVVEGEADRSPLEVAGFYERAAEGRGHFLIREEIRRVAVERIADAFRGLPRVTLDERRPLTGGPGVMAPPAIVIRDGPGECYPTLYVDRAVVASGVTGPVRPDVYVSPSEVEAIEIYTRSNDVPMEFNPVSNCGVVVIWTRLR